LVTKDKTSEVANQVVQETIIKRPTCPNTSDDFNSLVQSGQVVTLAENLNSYGMNGQFVNEKVTIVKRTGSGSEVSCGYLYAEVQVGKRPLQQDWENLYVNPSEFGGHIITTNAIVNKEENNQTNLLFDLSKMTYNI